MSDWSEAWKENAAKTKKRQWRNERVDVVEILYSPGPRWCFVLIFEWCIFFMANKGSDKVNTNYVWVTMLASQVRRRNKRAFSHWGLEWSPNLHPPTGFGWLASNGTVIWRRNWGCWVRRYRPHIWGMTVVAHAFLPTSKGFRMSGLCLLVVVWRVGGVDEFINSHKERILLWLCFMFLYEITFCL